MTQRVSSSFNCTSPLPGAYFTHSCCIPTILYIQTVSKSRIHSLQLTDDNTTVTDSKDQFSYVYGRLQVPVITVHTADNDPVYKRN